MNIAFECSREASRRFRAAVSLHGHTLHSRETLAFANTLAARHRAVKAAIHYVGRRFKAAQDSTLDLSRAWWTPPLGPRDAWKVERKHIENRFGLQAIVSLTDHDDIEAPMSLRVLDQCKEVPVSVEWTVPFQETFFHLGIHNLPVDEARTYMARFAAFTAGDRTTPLSDLLDAVASIPDALIVFNHPMWDEGGIGRENHRATARLFQQRYGQFLHAIEMNGLRPWAENKASLEFARGFDRPVISGGDRHGFEPNAVLNLTNAGSFSEFAEEVRSGVSNVLVTDTYRESFGLRILQNTEEILRDYEGHCRGWVRWSDRAFYRCDDGETRSLTELFSKRMPLQTVVRGIRITGYRGMKWAFRSTLARRQELA